MSARGAYVAGHAVGLLEGSQNVCAKGPPSDWQIPLLRSQISGESYSTDTTRRVAPPQFGPLISSRYALSKIDACEVAAVRKTDAMVPLNWVALETTEPPDSQMKTAEAFASSWYWIVEPIVRFVSFQVATKSATRLPFVTIDAVVREKVAKPAEPACAAIASDITTSRLYAPIATLVRSLFLDSWLGPTSLLFKRARKRLGVKPLSCLELIGVHSSAQSN